MGGKAREKMSWEKIDSSTYQYDEGGVRFFLLIGKKEALLIDSGMQTHNAKELAKELTRFIHEKNENGAAADESKTALECEAVFGYAERVLYSSSHASSPEEYEKYYAFIKTF